MKLIPKLSLLLCMMTTAAHSAVEVNAIAAKVNGRVVTKNEVSFLLSPVRSYLTAKYPRETSEYRKELKEAKDKVLEELIERELVIHEFKEMQATIPDHIIESEIRRKIHSDFNGSDSQFRNELKNQGISYEKFKDLTRRKLIVQAMRAQQFSDIAPPTPSELRKEYNKLAPKIRDTSKDKCDFEKMYIPMIDPDNLAATPESQLKLAEDLVKQLNEGADFAELAKKHSKDAFAEDGGKQEDIARVDLSPGIAMMIFETPENTILGPLKDGRGYHIIRCTKQKLGPTPPLSDSKVRKLVESNVRREKSSARYDRWIARIKSNAMIDRNM